MFKAINAFLNGIFLLFFALVLIGFCIAGAETLMTGTNIMQQIAGTLMLGFGVLIGTVIAVGNKQLEVLREIRDYTLKVREAADPDRKAG